MPKHTQLNAVEMVNIGPKSGAQSVGSDIQAASCEYSAAFTIRFTRSELVASRPVRSRSLWTKWATTLTGSTPPATVTRAEPPISM